MNKHNIFQIYKKYLNEFGFGDYTIDFSDVTDKNMIKLCEFIKTIVINRGNQNE